MKKEREIVSVFIMFRARQQILDNTQDVDVDTYIKMAKNSF